MTTGFKMVPLVPTEEMLVVMHDRILIGVNSKKREANILNDKAWWAAVVAAAPASPKSDFDRVTAERDALQQLLNAADERRDLLEGLLRRAAFTHDLLNPISLLSLRRDIHAALKPADGAGDAPAVTRTTDLKG